MAEKRSVPIMTVEAFEREMSRGIFGAYLFFGEEDQLKEIKLREIRRSILQAEGFELFNHFNISFSGASDMPRDRIMSSLCDAVDATPMMQDKKLIEVHDLDMDKISSSELDTLVSVCKSIAEDTVLIIFCRESELSCEYRFEQKTMFLKISSAAKPVRFTPLTKGRLISYVKKYLAKRQLLITDEATDALCDMCACRLMLIISELSKLTAYFDKTEKEIELGDVKRICSVAEADEVPFALLEAMQKWNVNSVLEAISMSRDMREDPIAVVSKMGRIYSDMFLIKAGMNDGMSGAEMSKALRMNAYRIEKYMTSLKRAPIEIIELAIREIYKLDVALKSAPSDPWLLIESFAARVYMPRSMR